MRELMKYLIPILIVFCVSIGFTQAQNVGSGYTFLSLPEGAIGCRNSSQDNTTELESEIYKLGTSKDRLVILKAMFAKSYKKKYISDESTVQNKILQVKILEQIRYELRQYH